MCNADLYTVTYEGKKYICREINFTDPNGDSHCYNIGDELLNEAIMDKDCELKTDEAYFIDGYIYGYCPADVLIEGTDEELAYKLHKEFYEMW